MTSGLGSWQLVGIFSLSPGSKPCRWQGSATSNYCADFPFALLGVRENFPSSLDAGCTPWYTSFPVTPVQSPVPFTGSSLPLTQRKVCFYLFNSHRFFFCPSSLLRETAVIPKSGLWGLFSKFLLAPDFCFFVFLLLWFFFSFLIFAATNFGLYSNRPFQQLICWAFEFENYDF